MNIFRPIKTLKNFFELSSKRLLCVRAENAQKLEETIWDVVISGGGMVGCSMACSLGSSEILSEKKILLLETSEKTQYNIDPSKYSNRVCALNPNTRNLFSGFHAWDKICNTRMKEVRKLMVWESCSDARISFEHAGMMDNVAYIVENDVILKALYERLDELTARVEVIKGSKAVDYVFPTEDTDLVNIQTDKGLTLKTRLLIGADGIHSLVRKKMKVKYVSWNYDQKGIVATLKLSEPTENIVAWQRFLPTGPIALLPLTDDLCSLVWTVSLPMCDKLLNMSEEEFVDALNSALWDESSKNPLVESALSTVKNVLSTITPSAESVRQLPPSILSVEPKSRGAFPLGLGHSTEYVAQGVALVGDSAHRVHPLAGQGVNLGFGDVQCLTECLETAVYNGNGIGHLNSLLDYEVKRQRHVVPAMFAIDSLNRLYKTEFTPFVLMRGLGLTVLDALSPIKEKIIHQASA
ncbi:ubiquinone biosynthesis monooxygenase COQ6, mitochondrial-like [Uloborus diversus]|uniref:ubiquinone biosynthesis monooxygenase COQ6, mitochondrial-like n=1 Tax=Uloborus diversus TaxID=327109 RepID=UPI002409E48A|nr:ubiquinone biosynthesis monooxygenase COQ6, mitochondrial-like [Uloborus diversus]